MRITDNAENTGNSTTIQVTIDGASPIIAAYPSTAQCTEDTTPHFNATVYDAGVGVDTCVFDIYVNTIYDSTNYTTPVSGNCTYEHPTALNPGENIYVIASANDSFGNMSLTNTSGTYTISGGDLDAPSLINPANDTWNKTLTPDFNWSDVGSSGCTYFQEYHFQADNNSDFSSPECNINITDSNYSSCTLADSESYYWRVASIDNMDVYNWSETYYVKIDITIPYFEMEHAGTGTGEYSDFECISDTTPFVYLSNYGDTYSGVKEAVFQYCDDGSAEEGPVQCTSWSTTQTDSTQADGLNNTYPDLAPGIYDLVANVYDNAENTDWWSNENDNFINNVTIGGDVQCDEHAPELTSCYNTAGADGCTNDWNTLEIQYYCASGCSLVNDGCEQEFGAEAICDEKNINDAWNNITTCSWCGNSCEETLDDICHADSPTCDFGSCGSTYCLDNTTDQCYHDTDQTRDCDNTGWEDFAKEACSKPTYCSGGSCTQGNTCYYEPIGNIADNRSDDCNYLGCNISQCTIGFGIICAPATGCTPDDTECNIDCISAGYLNGTIVGNTCNCAPSNFTVSYMPDPVEGGTYANFTATENSDNASVEWLDLEGDLLRMDICTDSSCSSNLYTGWYCTDLDGSEMTANCSKQTPSCDYNASLNYWIGINDTNGTQIQEIAGIGSYSSKRTVSCTCAGDVECYSNICDNDGVGFPDDFDCTECSGELDQHGDCEYECGADSQCDELDTGYSYWCNASNMVSEECGEADACNYTTAGGQIGTCEADNDLDSNCNAITECDELTTGTSILYCNKGDQTYFQDQCSTSCLGEDMDTICRASGDLGGSDGCTASIECSSITEGQCGTNNYLCNSCETPTLCDTSVHDNETGNNTLLFGECYDTDGCVSGACYTNTTHYDYCTGDTVHQYESSGSDTNGVDDCVEVDAFDCKDYQSCTDSDSGLTFLTGGNVTGNDTIMPSCNNGVCDTGSPYSFFDTCGGTDYNSDSVGDILTEQQCHADPTAQNYPYLNTTKDCREYETASTGDTDDSPASLGTCTSSSVALCKNVTGAGDYCGTASQGPAIIEGCVNAGDCPGGADCRYVEGIWNDTNANNVNETRRICNRL